MKTQLLYFLFASFFALKAHAFTIENDFENGSGVVQGGPNEFTDAAGDTVYDDCPARAGRCAKMSINKGSDGWGTWGGRITFNRAGVENIPRGGEFWVSVDMYLPNDFNWKGSPRLKFLRLHTTSGSNNEGYNDVYKTPPPFGSFCEWDGSKNNCAPWVLINEFNTGNFFAGEPATDDPKLGEWETYNLYIKLDPQNGRMIFSKGGKVLIDQVMPTLSTSKSFADAFLMFTYWNREAPRTQSLWIDNLRISTDGPADTAPIDPVEPIEPPVVEPEPVEPEPVEPPEPCTPEPQEPVQCELPSLRCHNDAQPLLVCGAVLPQQ